MTMDLVKLALEMMAGTQVDEVLRRAVTTLREQHPGSWAVLHRIEPGRYGSGVAGIIGHAELRRLADVACGPETWLSVDHLAEATEVESRPAWVAHPNSTDADAEVVVGWWAEGCCDVPSIVEMRRAAELAASALSNAKVVDYLVRQSCHDPLTGLLNRRGILETLKRERARARRRGTPLSVLFVDVDRFKEINDTHGHRIGDEVLHGIARRLSESLRMTDALGRLGGDEFLLVLPETPLRAARRIGKRLAREVAATPIVTAHLAVEIGISHGSSSLDDNQTEMDVIEQADRRMLARKRRRRTATELIRWFPYGKQGLTARAGNSR
ncbi:MAG: GGDEF domain-containing protein [bacterium]|nr:GGDEF domain-containing protein [bacterium]